MKPKDDGRSAFPLASEFTPADGMTLRQWYAGQALPAVIHVTKDLPLGPRDVALEVVQYADALIAELDKKT